MIKRQFIRQGRRITASHATDTDSATVQHSE